MSAYHRGKNPKDALLQFLVKGTHQTKEGHRSPKPAIRKLLGPTFLGLSRSTKPRADCEENEAEGGMQRPARRRMAPILLPNSPAMGEGRGWGADQGKKRVALCQGVTPASLGYPLAVFRKYSTLKPETLVIRWVSATV